MPAPAARLPAPAAADKDMDARVSAPDVGVGVGQLRISRSRQAPRIDADVKQAYAALTAGDDDRAETLYRQALARNPDNINARYGLAGLAMRQSRFDAAYEHYRAIADADPGDGRATAALLALEGAGPEGESRLKRLAAAEPDNDIVHFSLGTFYARQQRWPYAQQAFFEALRLDSGNPDYAFNLAVSLDQMGKTQAALGYYETALALADRRAARFDAARVLSRISAISQAGP
ncbi:MAG: tetratricopeptide repeat protein [Gammaproteobacteria bacterium]|nr:tetratricopeptide repeat protein [Gammaproteobacteria bacterium]